MLKRVQCLWLRSIGATEAPVLVPLFPFWKVGGCQYLPPVGCGCGCGLLWGQLLLPLGEQQEVSPLELGGQQEVPPLELGKPPGMPLAPPQLAPPQPPLPSLPPLPPLPPQPLPPPPPPPQPPPLPEFPGVKQRKVAPGGAPPAVP